MIMKLILTKIESGVSHSDTDLLSRCSSYLEEAAFSLTTRCVVTSFPNVQFDHKKFMQLGTWVVSSAPARVDLSGGWSDTPPISYEFGGAVACLAVTLCNRKPLSARCRLASDIRGIKLTVENRDIENGEIREVDTVQIETVNDLSDFRDPLAKCALLKCAFIALGIIPIPLSRKGSNHENADGILSTLQKMQIGLELVSTSLLPHGSGLGTSSILAGCVLSSLGRCVGIQSATDKHELVAKVLILEQLLSTGGGWQDQVGGIYGGLKLCTADRNVIPVHVHVEQYEVPDEALTELNERLVLAYSGKPRLAKNILQNVIRRWAKRSPDIVKNVNDLVNGAHLCITSIQRSNFEELGTLLKMYWDQKKIMAGTNSGVEPIELKQMFDLLSFEGVTDGYALAGAGGGGFMTMILRKGMTVKDANRVLEKYEEKGHNSLKWYRCKLCNEGLESFNADDSLSFNIDWHNVKVTV
jgi:fucokinase